MAVPIATVPSRNPITFPTRTENLLALDEDTIGIGLNVCEAGTNECTLYSPYVSGWNVYEGAPVDLL